MKFTTEIDPAHLRINAAWRRGKTRDGKPITYLAPRYAKARAVVATSAADASDGWQFVGPVSVTIAIYFRKLTRTGPADGLPWGDVDGPIKGILDALQHSGVLADDAQVLEVYAIKFRDKDRPRIEIEITTPTPVPG